MNNYTTIFVLFVLAIHSIYAETEKEILEKMTKSYRKELCDEHLCSTYKIIFEDMSIQPPSSLKNDLISNCESCKSEVASYIEKWKVPSVAIMVFKSFPPPKSTYEWNDIVDDLTIIRNNLPDDVNSAINIYSCVRTKRRRAEFLRHSLVYAPSTYWQEVITDETVGDIRTKVDLSDIVLKRRYKETFKFFTKSVSVERLGKKESKYGWTHGDLMAFLEFDANRETQYLFKTYEDFNRLGSLYFFKYTDDQRDQAREHMTDASLSETPIEAVEAILTLNQANKFLFRELDITISNVCALFGPCTTKTCVSDIIDDKIKEQVKDFSNVGFSNMGEIVKLSQLRGNTFSSKDIVTYFLDLQSSFGWLKNMWDKKLPKLIERLYKLQLKHKDSKSSRVNYSTSLFQVASTKNWSLENVIDFVERAQSISLFVNYYDDFFKVVVDSSHSKVMATLALMDCYFIDDHNLWEIVEKKSPETKKTIASLTSFAGSCQHKMAMQSYLTDDKIKECSAEVIIKVSEYADKISTNNQDLLKEQYVFLFEKLCGSSDLSILESAKTQKWGFDMLKTKLK